MVNMNKLVFYYFANFDFSLILFFHFCPEYINCLINTHVYKRVIYTRINLFKTLFH